MRLVGPEGRKVISMEVSQVQEAQSSMRSGMTHRSAANGERSLGECVARTANTAAAVQDRIEDVPRAPIPGSEVEPAIAKNFLNDLLIQPIKAGDLH
jgi:hypothetical protein